MSHKDPYEILGVKRDASRDEIKRAYRVLAKRYHPDRNPGDKSAEQKFKDVQAAYELLDDPTKREQYDRFGAGGPIPDFQNWGAGSGTPFGGDVQFDFGSLGDITSIFEQFFTRPGPSARGGHRRSARAARRGANIEHTIEVTFEEALSGTTREALLSAGPGGKSERIEFHVPAGVYDGQRIRLRGKGQHGAGGRGDVLVTCRVRPHPKFRRNGANILVDLTLDIVDATLGAKVEVPTPHGPAMVTVPPGTSSGAKLRLRGKGMPAARGREAGDLHALVKIAAPRELSPRARELLEALRDELRQPSEQC